MELDSGGYQSCSASWHETKAMKHSEEADEDPTQEDLEGRRRVHWSVDLEHIHYISTCSSEAADSFHDPTSSSNIWKLSEGTSSSYGNKLMAVKGHLGNLVHRARGKSMKINLEKIREKHGLW